jgi:hypothetical protein
MRGARGGGKRGKFLGGGAEWIVEAMGKREGESRLADIFYSHSDKNA